MPVPEGLVSRNSDVMLDSSQISDLQQESQVSIQENQKDDELVPPEIRQESERMEVVQKKADSFQEFKTEEAISKFLAGLESMPITEL